MHFSALNVIQHPLELSPSLDALAAFAFFNVGTQPLFGESVVRLSGSP